MRRARQALDAVEVGHVIAAGLGELGERLAEWLLGVLDDPDSRRRITGIVRSAASAPEAARAARAVVADRVLVPITEAIDAISPSSAPA